MVKSNNGVPSKILAVSILGFLFIGLIVGYLIKDSMEYKKDIQELNESIITYTNLQDISANTKTSNSKEPYLETTKSKNKNKNNMEIVIKLADDVMFTANMKGYNKVVFSYTDDDSLVYTMKRYVSGSTFEDFGEIGSPIKVTPSIIFIKKDGVTDRKLKKAFENSKYARDYKEKFFVKTDYKKESQEYKLYKKNHTLKYDAKRNKLDLPIYTYNEYKKFLR